MTEYIKKNDKLTYDHSRCLHCGKELKKPYDICKEIQNVLNAHPVPLSSREIQNYLENASYDSLEYYIKIEKDHLEQLLKDFTDVEIIRFIENGHTYYMTRKQLKHKT